VAVGASGLINNSRDNVRQAGLILTTVLARELERQFHLVHDARIIPTDVLGLEPLPSDSLGEIVTGTSALANPARTAGRQTPDNHLGDHSRATKKQPAPEIDVVGTVQSSDLRVRRRSAAATATFSSGVGGNTEPTRPDPEGDLSHLHTALAQSTLPVRNPLAAIRCARMSSTAPTQVRVKHWKIRFAPRWKTPDRVAAYVSAYEACNPNDTDAGTIARHEQEKFDVGLSTNFLGDHIGLRGPGAFHTEVAALDAYAKAKTLDVSVGLS